MNGIRLIIILLTLKVISIPVARAQLGFEDHAFPEIITSARALAMGNAFIAKTDDPWAVFYNPAGLGTVRGSALQMGQIHTEFNNGFWDLTKGEGSSTVSKMMRNFNADGLRRNLMDRPGNMSHSRLSLFPNFTTRYLSFGYVYSQQARARLTDLNSDMEFATRTDHGPLLGMNFSFFGGILKLGASTVYLHRRQLQAEYDINQTIEIPREDYDIGRAFITNLGARVTLPYTFLPTFAAVMRNATNSSFKATRSNDTPEDIARSIDLGVSITPQVGQVTRMHLEVNYKDLSDEYDTDMKRRLGMGVEFDMWRRYFVRFGYGDGFGSAGIGLRHQAFSFDLTTYAVDLSENRFRGEEDRRWVLSFGSGF